MNEERIMYRRGWRFWLLQFIVVSFLASGALAKVLSGDFGDMSLADWGILYAQLGFAWALFDGLKTKEICILWNDSTMSFSVDGKQIYSGSLEALRLSTLTERYAKINFPNQNQDYRIPVTRASSELMKLIQSLQKV